MNGTPWHEFIFLLVFVVLVFVVPIIVIRASYSPTTKFDVSTLWTHQGRVDKFAVIILGTWWVHTTSLIMWTLLRTVATADYATYMGWAIPIIAKMFAPDKAPPPT
jgi:hypothetical protein